MLWPKAITPTLSLIHISQLDDLKLQLKAAEDEAEKARYEAEHALESAEKTRDALIKQGEEELEATRRKAHELMQGLQNQAYAQICIRDRYYGGPFRQLYRCVHVLDYRLFLCAQPR